ncbi:MAG: 3',5'-cyclic-AMP phosphodiesterase [Methylotetracoccus sp.]|nr:3',5'-cyclic-AMP phosphodiesterase [Methylotetracoccus sp.]
MNTLATSSAADTADASVSVVRILQLTDCHFFAEPGQTLQGIDTEQSFSSVARAVLASGARYDLVLLTGDLAETPSEAAYRRLQEQLRLLEIPCYCLPGNHDQIGAMTRFLLGGQIHMQPRIILGPWQIVCLDSTVENEPGGLLSETQIELVEEAIAGQPEKYLLIAVHHHPIPCGSEWMDTMMIRNAERLLTLLDGFAAKARGVVFGHIHQALDLSRGHLRFLGSPSTCCQFQPNTRNIAISPVPPGYRWLELTADGEIVSGVGFAHG